MMRRSGRSIWVIAARRDLRGTKWRIPFYCPYQYLQSLEPSQLVLPDKDRKSLVKLQESNDPTETPLGLTEAPHCPVCDNIVMPQALLFDEGYHSHSFYQFEEAEDLLRDCHVIVFCGTSFAVNLTSVALEHARDMDIPVFNFNLHDVLPATSRLNASNIMGKAHESLPKLVEAIQRIQKEEEAVASTED